MTKRSKGEGTLYKRQDGRWYAQITLPSGSRKGFYGKDKAGVKRRMREAQTAISKGLTLPDESQSVAEYLPRWLATELKIRASTRRTYAYDVAKIVAYFGEAPLAKLGPQQVQLFYADLLKTHSTTRAHHVHSVLHHALYDAVRLSLIDKNPVALVDAPPPAHREMRTLSEDQANELLKAAQGHRYETLYLLALRTGMRRGELLALRWQDVDLRHGSLVVHASLQRVDRPGERVIIGDTKTANSHRTVKVSPAVVEALKAHQQQQRLDRLAAADWQPLDLVFPGRGGKIQPPEMPSRALDTLLRSAGLPDVRFHDLRHTCVTILLARGVQPHTVAAMIGDDVKTMLSVYAHVTTSMLEQAASVMDSVFGG